MKQNLWWAAGYNLISVPIAAVVLAPLGFVRPMAVGALLISASTVVVALKAQLLRRLGLSLSLGPIAAAKERKSSTRGSWPTHVDRRIVCKDWQRPIRMLIALTLLPRRIVGLQAFCPRSSRAFRSTT
jgi:hypothetical protein